MKAVVIEQPDGRDESLTVREMQDPAAGPGEAVVEVAYGGLNYADIMMWRGIYPHPKGYPLVAGIEFSGTVRAVGPGVTHVRPGDRVAAFSEGAGAFAGLCKIEAERLVPLHDDIALDIAAAFCVQGLTAWHLLHTISRTKPGDIVLVHAIGGGVGLYLTQLAVQAGATVLGTVGTAGKEKRPLEWGAKRVVHRDEMDFRQMVMEETGGRGVDKIIDSTGGSILDRSFEVIRTMGHVVSYGEAEDKPYATLWERLVRGSLTFSRLHIGHVDFRSDAWRQAAEEVMGRIADGRLKVPVEGIYGLDQLPELYHRLDSRTVAGKLLLKIGG